MSLAMRILQYLRSLNPGYADCIEKEFTDELAAEEYVGEAYRVGAFAELEWAAEHGWSRDE